MIRIKSNGPSLKVARTIDPQVVVFVANICSLFLSLTKKNLIIFNCTDHIHDNYSEFKASFKKNKVLINLSISNEF